MTSGTERSGTDLDSPVPDAVTSRGAVSPGLFGWLTVASTGGPLALAAYYVPGVLGAAKPASPLIAVLGVVLFLPPLLVWLGYSRQVVGPGGLYAFVLAGAGRTVATVQAGLWVLSYALYLIYTATFVGYDVMPSVFSGASAARPLVQMLTVAAVAGVVLLPIRRALLALAAVAVGQVLLVAALVGVEWGHRVPHPAVAAVRTSDVLVAGGNLSILFICAGLPLFLGGEVTGGARTVRRSLSWGWALAAGVTVAATVPMAVLAPDLLERPFPGVALATDAGLPALATAIGVGVMASVAAVMVAEFLALSRLLHAVTGSAVRTMSRVLVAVLVVGSALSLAQPQRVYTDLLKPSLVALWLSQLLVFAAFPMFVYRRGLRIRGGLPGAVLLAVAAGALMIFGLWSTLRNQPGT